MSIPKYIMDMMDKIPKHKEEDIIIARIPKRNTWRLYPNNLKINTINYPKINVKEHRRSDYYMQKVYPKYTSYQVNN